MTTTERTHSVNLSRAAIQNTTANIVSAAERIKEMLPGIPTGSLSAKAQQLLKNIMAQADFIDRTATKLNNEV